MDKKTLGDSARTFALKALSSAPTGVGLNTDKNADHVATFMVAFHGFCKAESSAQRYCRALERLKNPETDIPRVVERVGQALQLLREEQTPEVTFIARSMLEDAMRSLGREDLIP